MLHDLDTTLINVLRTGQAPSRLRSAEISFATPESGYAPDASDRSLNIFLYEVKENRELRSVEPIETMIGNVTVRRRAPLRVDCCYLVTAWSRSLTKIVDEHELLGVAYAWLSKLSVIPDRLLVGSLIGQPYSPPSLIAQWDAAKNIGEFWSALGIPPRPFFTMVVTIALDLDQSCEDTIVRTVATTYRTPAPGSEAELMIIGGTVLDNGSNAVANAWVRLEPGGLTQVADASGRFIFSNLARGAGYSLRALATGHSVAAELNNFEVPSLTGDYDLRFP